MIRFTMNDKFLANIFSSYECRYCPKCKLINWFLANVEIESSKPTFVDAVECWNCKTSFWADTYEAQIINKSDLPPKILFEGVVNPGIPKDSLYLLLDSAEIQLSDLKQDNCVEIQSIIDDLEKSINLIKEKLSLNQTVT